MRRPRRSSIPSRDRVRRRQRRSAAAAALALLALLTGIACQRPVLPAEIPERLAALGPPNLVLIVVDTLRADFTTPY